jgi:peptidoglycan L-alanyl-D-glutamate endopeptidase CwlK
MPEFSKQSRSKLETCHQDLQTVFHYVVQTRDCTVVYGHRTPEEQFELFKKGRAEVDGRWKIVKPQHVVTYKDGMEDPSRHNSYPSEAIDVVPYPEMWSSIDAFRQFGNYVKGVISMMLKYGTIENYIEYGGDWNWKDYAHWQLKK